MKILRLWMVLTAVIAVSSGRASADRPWVEIQSPHFTIVCNGSEKEGRDAAVDLERTRSVLMKLLSNVHQDPNVPIIVFVTADENTFANLVPAYNQRAQGNKPSNIFRTGRDRNYIVMRVVFRGSSEYQLKYDYAGLMAGINFRGAPIWLSSGFAEFFAQSEIEDTKAKIGLPSLRHVQRIEKVPLIPLPKLFTMGTNSEEYKDPEQRWVFDSESWGLFHYLLLGENGAHRAELIKYLDLLSHGKKRLDAAQEAFGDLKKLQDKLWPYYALKAYPILQLDLSKENYGAQLSSRNLSLAESNAWIAEFYLRFKRQTDAKPLIDAALSNNPNAPRAHEAQGIYDLELANYDDALKEFSAATALDSSLYLAYYYKAILSSYWKTPAEVPESSEQDLRHTLETVPRYAPAALALARLLVRRDGNFAEAEQFARRAVEAEPGIPRYQLAYANILLLAGNKNLAEQEATQALGNELSPLEGESAKALLQLAQECKPGGPCKALGRSERGSSGESAAVLLTGAAIPGTPSTDPPIPIYRVEGEIRMIECAPEGRVATLAASGKELKFDMAKTARVSWPETFWLDSAYLNVCKHFVGDLGVMTHKDAGPGPEFQGATALEVQDRY
ncbi:MAG: hypothetical protein WB723_01870 [Candidatus Acidiferrales bacterium]